MGKKKWKKNPSRKKRQELINQVTELRNYKKSWGLIEESKAGEHGLLSILPEDAEETEMRDKRVKSKEGEREKW